MYLQKRSFVDKHIANICIQISFALKIIMTFFCQKINYELSNNFLYTSTDMLFFFKTMLLFLKKFNNKQNKKKVNKTKKSYFILTKTVSSIKNKLKNCVKYKNKIIWSNIALVNLDKIQRPKIFFLYSLNPAIERYKSLPFSPRKLPFLPCSKTPIRTKIQTLQSFIQNSDLGVQDFQFFCLKLNWVRASYAE